MPSLQLSPMVPRTLRSWPRWQNDGLNAGIAAEMALLRGFLLPPAGSFFLFGPRGTGKSTWLAQMFPVAIRLELLAPVALRTYQARPE